MEPATFVTRTVAIHVFKALHTNLFGKCSQYIAKDILAAIEKSVRWQCAFYLYGVGIGPPIFTASRESRTIHRCPRAVHKKCSRIDSGCSNHGPLISVEVPETYFVTLCGLVKDNDLPRFRREFSDFVHSLSVKLDRAGVEVMPYEEQ